MRNNWLGMQAARKNQVCNSVHVVKIADTNTKSDTLQGGLRDLDEAL